MKEENDNMLGGETLEVFCFDSIDCKDRTTFDSCTVDGIQMTFWMEEADVRERLRSMFDILFGEMVRNRAKRGVS